ncbi:MAG: hypothetical protein EOP53_06570 [Sphingobacteriales bacterium]|nr:MAG: hypothetical protein EOP53_06570 [Sphingobacteriales bacterium]
MGKLKLNIVKSRFVPVDIENVSSNDDATEKEEKKVETEFFTQHFNFIENTIWAEKEQEKLIAPASFNKLTFFPEVLTPPPSL